MMVTFISQCEKKALKKTRRVLDSFADRIGDNTWQTIITQEGLNAVQKLLRKTASKSTSVSCHWIRSRSRSEFLWVVGNKRKFNSEGIVPVHYTDIEKFIGEKEIMMDNFFANTNGQRLDKHLFAVGYTAMKLVENLVPNDENLCRLSFVAGCWHDVGKIDDTFQNWIEKKINKKYKKLDEDGIHIDKKFTFDKYPRHNEVSLLLFELFSKNNLSKEQIKMIKHSIFWHHSKPYRDKKSDINSLIDIYNKIEDFDLKMPDLRSNLKALFSSINNNCDKFSIDQLDNNFFCRIDDFDNFLEDESLPVYKRYSSKESLDKYLGDITYNARNNIIRSAIVTADRLISSLSKEDLNKSLENKTLDERVKKALLKDADLITHIKSCLDKFEKDYPNSQRNIKQSKAARDLADEEVEIGILKGPAGCGKTKIALEWSLNTKAKKIYWICPRIQVCEGIFSDLTSNEYLPNATVEIVTNEIKLTHVNNEIVESEENKLFSSEVVITTIDQIINSITTHKNVTTFVELLNSHVVFDEYHEYINMSGFNLLFAEIVTAKKLQQNDDTLPNTLLVSATPNPLFVTEFLKLRKNDIIGIDSFNDKKYQITFKKYDESDEVTPLNETQKDPLTFVITNTAIAAQKSFIKHQCSEKVILFHSKFKKSDKEMLFDKVYNTFRKNGTKEYDVLRSGPIVQASLNITCNKMISEMTYSENFLQRLGRLDRFGINESTNQYIIAITQAVKDGKQTSISSKFLAKMYALQSTKAWYEYLENNLGDEFGINEIYKLYDKFYNDEIYKGQIKQDLIGCLKNSVVLINNKIMDPLSNPKKKKIEDSKSIKIKKHSLRGDSLFVQMAKCQIESFNKIEILEEYAYDNIEDAMTMEVKEIEGYDTSEKNLLSFMAKKHHNIKDVKRPYKDTQIKSDARDPHKPIYVSYTLSDLEKVNSKPHEDAKYYGVGINQPIGIISLNQIKGENKND